MGDQKEEIIDFFKSWDVPKIVLLNFKEKKGIKLDLEISNVIKFLVNEKKLKCIYISIRTPSIHLIEIFKKNDIDISNILFIDVISQYIYVSSPEISISSEVKSEKLENVIMLSSPINLTELGIIFLEISSSFEKDKNCFIVLDSLDSILLYIEKDKFLKFFHFLVTKLKLFKVLGIFIQTSEKKEIIEDVKYLIDEIFTIPEEI